MFGSRFHTHLPSYMHRLFFSLMLMSIFSSPIQAETHPDIATLTNLFNALQAVEKTIPRDSFEASAVLPNTELTPESLNTWVRENTWLIPYNGALRDAQGVLMDRVGNSLDRALLLQTMLRELGYDTRLAQSTLTEKQAKQVFIERRPLPINTLPTSIESPEQIEKLIKEFHLDPTQLAKIKAETEKTQQQLKTTLQERVERQTSELLKLLGTLPNPPPDESYKALQDHWWVQYQEKDQWFDLDPTLSAELAQQIHSTPLKIHDINKLDKLSPELLHSVIIKVILECYKDKKITENILTQTPPILPSDVLGKPVSVNHIAVNLPNDLNASDLNAFKETLQKQAHWFPVITVADQQYFDQEYTPDCVLSKAKPPQTGTAIDNKIEDILEEAFDTPDFPQNTPSAIPDSNTFITSMWLEYEVHTPNQPKQTIHRQLFDLIGAAQRAVGKIDKQPNEEQQLTWRLALLGGTDILAYGHGVSDDYLWKLSSQHLSKNYNPILQILENIDDLQIIKQEAKKLKPLSILLYTLAHLRSYSHQATFIDQLNIISIHRQLKHENTNLKLLEAFDIVKNNSFGKMQTFNNQVKQGVIDTNAEALLLLNCPAIQTEKCSESINTAKLWELAKAQNIKWQLIRTPQELHKLKISPDITQQMTTQLKQGYVVITPEKPILVNDKVITNWWVINPKTGHTLGIGETGWGTAMSEYISLLNVAISSSFCMALATSSRDIALCTVAMVLGFTGTTIGAAYQTGAALLNLTGTLVVGAPAVAKSVSRRSK